VLYVAMTRARRRLHLIASVDPTKPEPRSGSLLATLWPARAELPSTSGQWEAAVETTFPEFIEMPLRRYSIPAGEGPDEVRVPAHLPASEGRPEFEWVNPASVQVGTVIHRELYHLARLAAAAGTPVPPVIARARYQRELALLGVEEPDLGEAARRVEEALVRVWEDPTGRWILAPHAEAWSEQRLTLRVGTTLEHIRLDRSFVDDEGRRWIIDYKTGRHLGADSEAFLADSS
jgi:ATP-dependent exoDNAse (exonuclease V) beta subunit